ncbi:two-component sensor histidine kinase [Cryobacterium sp. 1639]|uniref:sensor histidine kinase n=1 Tax=Cryobacterium inferilacus TaxID=2866629 RepID=UPI001C7389D2|nr:histidine kinase [Cryobacterium sp. 1639]MBX0299523.1 two-component sensor histidine kinase [Cryobacterium sp. 1639]
MLPSPGAWRRTLRRHPWLSDAVSAGLYGLLAAGLALISANPPLRTPVWFTLALLVAGIATVLFRRRRPVLMLAAATGLCLLSLAGGTGAETVLTLITLHAVGTYRSAPTAWVSYLAASLVACGAAWILVVRANDGLPLWEPLAPPTSADPVNDWLNAALLMLIPLLIAQLFGVNAGQRRRYVAALVDRAVRLERERDQQAQIARAGERERIAREMHDVMAHSVSVMVALSEGARAAAAERPTDSMAAMGQVAETGRHTLGELRRLLGAVRTDGDAPAPEHAPQPGAPQLTDLAAQFGLAGLPVRLEVTGSASADPAVGLTVYRIVQESLTNALRHAHGATEVTATVTWSAGCVTILVQDDAPAAPDAVAGSDAPQPGRGLVGIRERAALYAGSVEAGPAVDGGWLVRVTLFWTKETA